MDFGGPMTWISEAARQNRQAGKTENRNNILVFFFGDVQKKCRSKIKGQNSLFYGGTSWKQCVQTVHPALYANPNPEPEAPPGKATHLVSVHECLAVTGSPPGDVGQGLAVGHAWDHGGAALHGRHVFQLGDVGLDCAKRKEKRDERRWTLWGGRLAMNHRVLNAELWRTTLAPTV